MEGSELLEVVVTYRCRWCTAEMDGVELAKEHRISCKDPFHRFSPIKFPFEEASPEMEAEYYRLMAEDSE